MSQQVEPQPEARRFNALRTARLLLVVVLGGFVLIRLSSCAERLAYFPARGSSQLPAGAEEIWFETEDGLTLHGWFFRARDAEPGETRPAVLHLHGNAGMMSDHIGFSRFLADEGMHLLMFDYRSYGQSDAGKLRRDPVLLDAHAALDALIARDDVDPDQIGVYGVSLGGAFALPLAATRDEVSALCTLATFSSWRSVAGDWLPIIGPLLLSGGWDPIDFITDLGETPYLIVHGDKDEVINFRHAGLLYKRADQEGVEVTKLSVPGGRHNTILESNPEVRHHISSFFLESLAENDEKARMLGQEP